MMELIRISGPTGIVHVLLAIVIVGLAALRARELAGGSFNPGAEWNASLNSVLFWGGFAAVLGLLGQTVGIYVALTEIRRATEVAPWIVVEGFMVSFTPTLIGLAILSGAALIWYALRTWASALAKRRAS